MVNTRLKTNGFNGYAVEFSPFFEHKLAVASAANYGIVGNGRLWVISNGRVEVIYETQDGCFDVAWSEIHENQLVTGCGDGSIKLWDTTLPDYPVQDWREHKREVFSINWNLVDKNLFLSSSWDNSIKMWNPLSPGSLQTFAEHQMCVYQAIWAPHSPTNFASCSGDQTVKLWDCRQPNSTATIHGHNSEILSLDWNKYRRDEIVTGSVDRLIRIWDLRMPGKHIGELVGHDYAIKRLKCSPHNGNLVGSVSYDMTMRLWDIGIGRPVFVHDAHTEFVVGLDFSLFIPGLIATCGWDELVCMFKP